VGDSIKQLLQVVEGISSSRWPAPEKWHPHVAKHTLGFLLARQNASAFLIRQRLGHKAISSSLVYANVNDRDAGRATSRVFLEVF
jgi:integrase